MTVSATGFLQAPAEAGQLYQASVTQPFLRITPQGSVFGRVNDGAGHDLEVQQIAGQLYCTTTNCDVCPAGTRGTPPPSLPLSDNLLIGLSAGLPGKTGSVQLTGESWDAYCHGSAL